MLVGLIADQVHFYLEKEFGNFGNQLKHFWIEHDNDHNILLYLKARFNKTCLVLVQVLKAKSD